MPWDNEFYAKYAEHLQEWLVKHTHFNMYWNFTNFVGNYEPISIIDFGCGTGEIMTCLPREVNYFGIDKNKVNENLPHMIGDFTDPSFEPRPPFVPNAFISVFASEIVWNAEDKYKFYHEVFRKYPKIRVGLVAGVYYLGNENDLTKEEDGFTIHQSVEKQQDWISDDFEEHRSYHKVPSKLWGPNVVEVWKILLRKTKFGN